MTMIKVQNVRRPGMLALLLLVMAVLSACAGEQDLSAASAPNAVPSATPPPTATLASPVQSMALAPSPDPTTMPVFSLVEVAASPTPASAREEQPLAAKPAPTETATVESSPTPQPTFTPPALPFTSPNEHYWLRRPIAEGGTVWTDKAYPYGSTRGGTLRPHHGVEFYVPTGTEIFAAASGTVVVAGSDAAVNYGPHLNFYGNLVVIELDTPFLGRPVFTLYAHLSDILVEAGQRVAAQELIALSGATGVADGSHLHFEVRVGENGYEFTRNPLLWLYPFPEHGTLAGRVVTPDGAPRHETRIFLRRVDAPSKYAETTTYANAGGELNADEGWNENFVFDDVVAGYYEVEVRRGSEKTTELVWIYPYRTSFVEIIIPQ